MWDVILSNPLDIVVGGDHGRQTHWSGSRARGASGASEGRARRTGAGTLIGDRGVPGRDAAVRCGKALWRSGSGSTATTPRMLRACATGREQAADRRSRPSKAPSCVSGCLPDPIRRVTGWSRSAWSTSTASPARTSTSRPPSFTTVWRETKRQGLSWLSPRPQNPRADDAAQEDFKKTSAPA